MSMGAFNTMSAIKKKMHGMKSLKDSSSDDVDQLEQKLVEIKAINEKQEGEIMNLNKRIGQIEGDLGVAKQSAEETNAKLEETTTQLNTAEAEMTQLGKNVRELEENFEQTEGKLIATTTKLDEANKSFEESDRGRKVLENRIAIDEERMGTLERELETAILFGEDSDRKFEETARKLAITEVDLERSEGRVHTAEAKIIELEDELKVVGNNFKSLEIVQQEFMARQEQYEMTIQSLTENLQDAENRALQAENAVNTLQKEIDRLEDELMGEKDKFRLVIGELDSTISELTGF